MQNGHIFLKQVVLPTHWIVLTDYFAPNHSSVVEMHVFHQIVCIFTCSKENIHLTPETLFTQKQMNLPKQTSNHIFGCSHPVSCSKSLL